MDAFFIHDQNAVKTRLLINTSGNVGIGTNSPTQRLVVAGNIYATGTITPNSDRNAKTGFAPVDAGDVLAAVADCPSNSGGSRRRTQP